MTIGERIKKRREELKWSQRKLSDMVGYSNHSTITKIEAGQVDLPTSKIEKFSEVLGVSVADLMGWSEEIERNPVEMAERHFEMIMDEDLNEIFDYLKKMDQKQRQIVKDLARSLSEA